MVIFKKVFRNPRYVGLAFLGTISLFLFSVWLPNLRLILEVFRSDVFMPSSRLLLLFNLAGSIRTNFTLFSAAYTVIIAILFGINLAMIIFYYRSVQLVDFKSASRATGGLVSGILGIGCASCGSIIITAILGTAAGSFLSFLPLGGEEFGLLGIALLLWSIFWIAKKINAPLVCEPKISA